MARRRGWCYPIHVRGERFKSGDCMLYMGTALGQVDAETGPPSAVPLQHFVVALVFLVTGVSAGALAVFQLVHVLPHVHLLLVGWVCISIMGAMTQFVPVWSDVSLHSRRLARAALVATGFGVAGLAVAFGFGRYTDAVLPGGVLLVGLWGFVYNIGRTLPTVDVRRLDVTETHFLFALAFVLVTTSLGVTLALDYRWSLLAETPFGRGDVVGTHAVFAVFGIVVTTVLGAMYQLVTMFTQTELHRLGTYVKRFEIRAYPVGVVALGVGRLLSAEAVVRIGSLLVLVSLLGFGVIVLRKLYESRVSILGHPMLVRYAVGVPALIVWTVVVSPSWVSHPLPSGFAGGTASAHVLLAGFVGYVVVGTVYHIIPFLVWVESYSDRLGLEDVPMIDDLYDPRLERADLTMTAVGTAGVVAGTGVGNVAVAGASGAVAVGGYAVFAVNVLLTVRRHKPGGVTGLFRRADAGTE